MVGYVLVFFQLNQTHVTRHMTSIMRFITGLTSKGLLERRSTGRQANGLTMCLEWEAKNQRCHCMCKRLGVLQKRSAQEYFAIRPRTDCFTHYTYLYSYIHLYMCVCKNLWMGPSYVWLCVEYVKWILDTLSFFFSTARFCNDLTLRLRFIVCISFFVLYNNLIMY